MQFHASVIGLSFLLMLMPLNASSFEKTNIDTSIAKSTEQGAVSQNEAAETPDNAGAAAQNLRTNSEDASESPTAISVPGIGTVGIIPKLDFGMELLYGNEEKQQTQQLPDAEEDSLQIRGTIKHRF